MRTSLADLSIQSGEPVEAFYRIRIWTPARDDGSWLLDEYDVWESVDASATIDWALSLVPAGGVAEVLVRAAQSSEDERFVRIYGHGADDGGAVREVVITTKD